MKVVKKDSYIGFKVYKNNYKKNDKKNDKLKYIKVYI